MFKKEEGFTEAYRKHGLEPHEVEGRKTFYLNVALIYFVCALFSFFYATLMLVHTFSFAAFVLSTIIGITFLFLSCRYHFWWFQLKSRRVKCTFREWFHYGLLCKEDESIG